MSVFRALQCNRRIQVVILLALLVLDQHDVGAQNDGQNGAFNSVLKSLEGVLGRARRLRACSASGCVRKAGQLLTYMKETVNPCDDFYEFACGNYDRELALQFGDSESSIFRMADGKLHRDIMKILERLTHYEYDSITRAAEPKFYQKIRNCFTSCYNTSQLNTLGLRPIKELIEAMNGWPVLGISGPAPKKIVFEGVNKAGFAHKNIVSLGYQRVVTETNTTVLVVGSPWSSSEIVDYPSTLMCMHWKRSCVNDEPAPAALRFAVELAILFGANRRNAETQMKEALQLECRLFKIENRCGRGSGGKIRSEYVFYHHLKSKLGFINLQSMLPKTIQLEPTDIFINESPKYIRNLKAILDTTEDRIFHNYLVYRAVRSVVQFLNDDARKLLLILGSGKEVRGLWCSRFTTERFSHGLNQMYLSEYTTPALRQQVEDMEKRIRETLRTKMESLTWMNPKTKAKALEKVDAMIATVVFLDEFRNPDAIDELYRKPFYDWDVKHLLRSELFYQSPARRFAGFNYTFDRSLWKNRLRMPTANAFYKLSTNSFFILPPVAQFPFFLVDVPNYVKYGTLGHIMGHEMGHGFDARGKNFDKNGNRANWWDPESDANFKKLSQCFVDQYKNYTFMDIKVDGKETLSENLADNLGLKLAHKAYEGWVAENSPEPYLPGLEKYTPNQMFWISFASDFCTKYTHLGADNARGQHAFNPVRVRATLTNLQEFADDFNCPLGSKMNPVHKCTGF